MAIEALRNKTPRQIRAAVNGFAMRYVEDWEGWVDVLFVAIDGVDGAGETTFADELERVFVASAKPVIRASVIDDTWKGRKSTWESAIRVSMRRWS